MVKHDNLVQWLVGDELKQDQFNFLYETLQVLYKSAVREKLVGMDETIQDVVIPQLVAYRSLMFLRNIQLKKASETKRMQEKEDREKLAGTKKEDAKGAIPTNEQIFERRLEEEKGAKSNLTELQK